MIKTRYVVSKTLGVRIECDGPLNVQVERLKLESALKEMGKESDVELQFVKRPPKRAHSEKAIKRGTKLRYK